MSIDPLSEKYNTWSPYTFSGNIVIHARELEGLEPHVLFGSLQEAGENFGSQYNGMSIRMDGEIGTLFYQTSDGKYAYTTPYTGGPDTGVVDPYMAEPIPKKTSFVGTGHTHGADRGRQFRLPGETIIRGDDDNKPSDIDVDESNKDAKSKTFQSNIVVTADGSIFIYGPTTNEDTVKPVNTNMPSDPRSPVRKNKVTPNNTPTVLPNGGDGPVIDNFNPIPNNTPKPPIPNRPPEPKKKTQQ